MNGETGIGNENAELMVPVDANSGDIGGFGIGSEFAWQWQAYAGYRFTKLFQVTAGYRRVSMDYGKGESDNRFVYDMATFGPVVRMGFSF